MHDTYKILLFIHVVMGFFAALVFWLPVLSKKGGRLHVLAGRAYVGGMYSAAATAIAIALLVLVDPIAAKHPAEALSVERSQGLAVQERTVSTFLLCIGVLVWASIRHGLLSLRAKADHRLMRAPSHLILNAVLGALGLALLGLGWYASQVLFYVFAVLCVGTAVTNLRYCLRPAPDRRAWLVSHMSSMIAAGIATYTAFFVFGGSRFLAPLLTGYWQLLPWVAPAVVGTVIIQLMARRYR